jgi:hypothetical protein
MAVDLIAEEPVVAARLIRGEFVSGFMQTALSKYPRRAGDAAQHRTIGGPARAIVDVLRELPGGRGG